jgi:hypothetical protein
MKRTEYYTIAATDGAGQTCYLHVCTEYEPCDVSNGPADAKLSETITSERGEPLGRESKGKYRSALGEVFLSDDPKAP